MIKNIWDWTGEDMFSPRDLVLIAFLGALFTTIWDYIA